MLFLLFHLASDRYALDAKGVVEVLPLLELRALPQAPAGIAGIFSYHGTPVPVLDLCRLGTGQSARRYFSSRIVLVTHPDRSGSARLLGLLVEQATSTLRREPADFADTGVGSAATPWLGPVTTDDQGLIHWVEPGRLLPATVRDLLFAGAG